MEKPIISLDFTIEDIISPESLKEISVVGEYNEETHYAKYL